MYEFNTWTWLYTSSHHHILHCSGARTVCFSDAALRGIVVAQWGDLKTSPSNSGSRYYTDQYTARHTHTYANNF